MINVEKNAGSSWRTWCAKWLSCPAAGGRVKASARGSSPLDASPSEVVFDREKRRPGRDLYLMHSEWTTAARILQVNFFDHIKCMHKGWSGRACVHRHLPLPQAMATSSAAVSNHVTLDTAMHNNNLKLWRAAVREKAQAQRHERVLMH